MKTKHAAIIRTAIATGRESQDSVGGLLMVSSDVLNAQVKGSLRHRAFTRAWNTSYAKADGRWNAGQAR